MLTVDILHVLCKCTTDILEFGWLSSSKVARYGAFYLTVVHDCYLEVSHLQYVLACNECDSISTNVLCDQIEHWLHNRC
jgi:hypothetical protein